MVPKNFHFPLRNERVKSLAYELIFFSSPPLSCFLIGTWSAKEIFRRNADTLETKVSGGFLYRYSIILIIRTPTGPRKYFELSNVRVTRAFDNSNYCRKKKIIRVIKRFFHMKTILHTSMKKISNVGQFSQFSWITSSITMDKELSLCCMPSPQNGT